MKRFNIYFDIETIPTQSEYIKNHVQTNLTPPANYKKQETIDAWIEENRLKWWFWLNSLYWLRD